jgi:hypothetical protein
VYGSGRRDDDDVDICAVESGRRRRRAAPRALLFGDGGAREDEASEKGVTACARGLLARASDARDGVRRRRAFLGVDEEVPALTLGGGPTSWKGQTRQ